MFDLPLLPSQDVVPGTEPLLFAATEPGARQGAYYGPRYNLVGPTKKVAPPRSTRGVDLASSLWSIAEQLTGTSLPAAARYTFAMTFSANHSRLRILSSSGSVSWPMM